MCPYCTVISGKLELPYHIFSVIKYFSKCNTPDLKFYLSKFFPFGVMLILSLFSIVINQIAKQRKQTPYAGNFIG